MSPEDRDAIATGIARQKIAEAFPLRHDPALVRLADDIATSVAAVVVDREPARKLVDQLHELLPPHVDGEEDADALLVEWVQVHALADTRLADVENTLGLHERILAAREALRQQWRTELEDIALQR